MKTYGKVLFFNQTDGKGILITSQKEKIEFNVHEWNDFDVMPSTGLLVVFEKKDGMACDIIAKISDVPQEIVASEKEELISNTPVITETAATYSIPDLSQIADDIDDGSASEQFIEENQESIDEVISDDSNQHVQEYPESKDDSEPLEPTSATGQVEEHFEKRDDIEILENPVDEIPPREESITVTLNLHMAVANYFKMIDQHINRRISYKKVEGRLNYLVIRRFLWTTFNNLSEIDLHIITPKIKTLSDDLKVMGGVYDDFSRKIRHPHLAYEEVFLSCQAEYLKIREATEKIIQKLNQLRTNEEIIGGILRVKKEELDKNIKSAEFNALKAEMKSLNGNYVDVVHMMAELDARYKHDLMLLHNFEKEYKEDFYDIFAVEAKKHKRDILEILDAQAYIVDAQLWQQAKVSKSVKAHFKKSSIDGELNTKTYLKYYLDTLDATKASEDTKKLFELYDYLVSIQKEYILVITSSFQEAMEYESAIKNVDKSYDVKSFVDEKEAIKWAMKNSVKVLILEDMLQKTNAETFLNIYHNNVLLKPKIVLVGSKPRTNSSAYTISKLLMKNAMPRVVADAVKSVLATKQVEGTQPTK